MPFDRNRYASLIDPDLWPFIDRVDELFPADSASLPIEQQRVLYDRMCREFHAGYPEGIAVRDDSAGSAGREIPTRVYLPTGQQPEAVVVYYHGGGYVFGGLDSHDDICAELCSATGFIVVSVDYRLAPEHLHPAAFDDALAAYRHVAQNRGLPVVLCGESAGGNLAAAVAHATRGDPLRPAGQVLIYPALGGDAAKPSAIEHADAPLLNIADVEAYDRLRSGDRRPAGDPSFAVLEDDDFSDLPPTIILTAECDPLSSDGEAYRDAVLAAGGRAHWREEPRLIHSYLRARATLPAAQEAFARIAFAVSELGRGAWPY